jgi:hypothetical protein
MDTVNQRLQSRGWRITHLQINSEGKDVIQLAHLEHPRVAMFRRDIADLARGRVTIDEIIVRNTGANLAGPWPVVE